jgi:hypothetical protein
MSRLKLLLIPALALSLLSGCIIVPVGHPGYYRPVPVYVYPEHHRCYH